MDSQRYWAIAEGDLEIQNPITDRKLRLLEDYCDIRDGLRVLDIGCGKAWVMRQWASRFAISGIGLEINPVFAAFARAHPPAHGQLTFIEGPASQYRSEPAGFDVTMCLGASFALGGLAATLDYMAAATRPGGTMVLGEMTLKHRPNLPTDEVLPHDSLDMIAVIERHGAEVSATISASDADFERYVSHHRHSTLIWGRQNLTHPDHADVLAKSRADWNYYLRWIRPHLGWTIFVGRRYD